MSKDEKDRKLFDLVTDMLGLPGKFDHPTGSDHIHQDRWTQILYSNFTLAPKRAPLQSDPKQLTAEHLLKTDHQKGADEN